MKRLGRADLLTALGPLAELVGVPAKFITKVWFEDGGVWVQYMHHEHSGVFERRERFIRLDAPILDESTKHQRCGTCGGCICGYTGE